MILSAETFGRFEPKGEAERLLLPRVMLDIVKRMYTIERAGSGACPSYFLLSSIV
jgi:hypothetical protein